MGKVTAIALPKGGVGKTTTAVNLAASLAAMHHPTLLIDLDTAGAAGLSLGFTEGNTRLGLYDAFNFTVALKSTVHKTEQPQLDVIPSNVHTLQREERLLRVADNRAILKALLDNVREEYDYVILDCPPFLRGLTTNALAAADSFMIPVKSGQLSLEAIQRFMGYVDWVRQVSNAELAFDGFVLTMFTPGASVCEMTVKELESKYAGYIYAAHIPENTHLAEATFVGKAVLQHAPTSPGALAYLALAREFQARASSSAVIHLQVKAFAGVGRA